MFDFEYLIFIKYPKKPAFIQKRMLNLLKD